MTAIGSPPQVIVAIEGPCFGGKTTLAGEVAARTGAAVIAEYADLGPLPPFPPTGTAAARAALEHFLTLDRTRARAARTAGTPLVLLDRSPLTLISYEYGITGIGVPSALQYAIDASTVAAETGEILTPNAYLYLHVSDHVAAARQARRGPVAAHLTHPIVQAGIDHACRAWLAAVPPRRRLLLDGATPLDQMCAATTAFLTAIGGPPPPSWHVLHRVLADEPRRQCAA